MTKDRQNTDEAARDENMHEAANERHKTDSQTNKKSSPKSKKKKTGTKSNDAILQEKVDELEINLAELNDKYLRLFSEFDNYRKRTNKERLDLLKSASEEVIKDLLPVIDDFERGIKAMQDNDALQTSVEGMQLINNKLLNILTKKGLEPINSIGQAFNTDFHEAITNIPAPAEDLKGKVVDEIEKGYTLNDKVIRFAKVVVGQ
jgi:molecular chaperone GrpE